MAVGVAVPDEPDAVGVAAGVPVGVRDGVGSGGVRGVLAGVGVGDTAGVTAGGFVLFASPIVYRTPSPDTASSAASPR